MMIVRDDEIKYFVKPITESIRVTGIIDTVNKYYIKTLNDTAFLQMLKRACIQVI